MKQAVFCDFDGTITVEETFVGMLQHFSPTLSDILMPQMYSLKLPLREGVRQLLESIPSTQYPNILSYAQTCEIRPGFIGFLEFLNTHDVPLIVVSGGVKGMVETVLKHLLPQISGIYAVDVDLSEENLTVFSHFEGGTELVSKVDVMNHIAPDIKIAIGDSVTDLNMALTADLVFARDRLAQYLDERQQPYVYWQNFYDIQNHLAELWLVQDS